MRVQRLVVLFLVALSAVSAVRADDPSGTETDVAVALRSLESSETAAEASEPAKRLVDHYRNLVSALDSALRQARSDGVRAELCWALGQLRGRDAVQTLYRHIDLEAFAPEADKLPRYEQWPCWGALVEIGRPAAREIIQQLRFVTDPEKRTLSLRAVLLILGHEEGKRVLTKFMEDPAVKRDRDQLRRLREALDEYQILERAPGQ